MKFVIKSSSTVKLYSGDIKIEALAQFLKENFASWNSNNLTYTDKDGDKITLSTQEDLDTLLAINSSSSYAKLEIAQESTEQTIQKTQEEKPKTLNVSTQPTETVPKKEENQSRKKFKKCQMSKSKSPKKSNDKKGREEKLKEKKQRSPYTKEEKPSGSSESSKSSSPKKQRLQKLEGLINQKVAEMVDERIKNLIPCLKNQLSQNFEVLVSDQNSQLKHQGIACNGCSMNPIIGIRYKCIECPTFNFCSSCEEKIEHQHNLLKMKKVDKKKEPNELWKVSKDFFREMKHRGASPESENERNHQKHRHFKGKSRWENQADSIEHRINKRLFKLRAVFGQQENFRQFIQKYSSLKPKELLEVYALQNNVSQEEFQAKRDEMRKTKLAAFYDCPEDEFNQVVKTYPKLNFREIIIKLKETGQRTFTGENFKKMRERLRKCHLEGPFEAKVEDKPGRKSLSKSKNSKRKESLAEEKVNVMKSLFGEEKQADYRKFISKNSKLNEDETIAKWIEKISK